MALNLLMAEAVQAEISSGAIESQASINFLLRTATDGQDLWLALYSKVHWIQIWRRGRPKVFGPKIRKHFLAEVLDHPRSVGGGTILLEHNSASRVFLLDPGQHLLRDQVQIDSLVDLDSFFDENQGRFLPVRRDPGPDHDGGQLLPPECCPELDRD